MKFPISEQIRSIHFPPISEVKGWLAAAAPELSLIDLCRYDEAKKGLLRAGLFCQERLCGEGNNPGIRPGLSAQCTTLSV
jgi:hypothetical protein